MDDGGREGFERFAIEGSLAIFDRTHPEMGLFSKEISEGLLLNDIG